MKSERASRAPAAGGVDALAELFPTGPTKQGAAPGASRERSDPSPTLDSQPTAKMEGDLAPPPAPVDAGGGTAPTVSIAIAGPRVRRQNYSFVGDPGDMSRMSTLAKAADISVSDLIRQAIAFFLEHVEQPR